MKTIALMNQKGGTGKTTSAINLAGELARRGKRVLIVDMDTQGNATSNLSLTDVPTATLADVITGKTVKIPDVICHTSTENLDVIRGGALLAPALTHMQEMPFGRDTTLRRLLPQIPDTYDYVFFDCSPSLESLFNINVLIAVEYVLIPIKVDKNSIEGYDVMLETIRSVREIANPDIRVLGIFMTAVESGSSLDKEAVIFVNDEYLITLNGVYWSSSIDAGAMFSRTVYQRTEETNWYSRDTIDLRNFNY